VAKHISNKDGLGQINRVVLDFLDIFRKKIKFKFDDSR
jgi:hypothetical protein